jgi:hypothetical protein
LYNGVKNFGWGLTVTNDAGAVVKPPINFGYLAFSNSVKVDAFREVFTDKAFDIFDSTPLPRAVGGRRSK